MHFAEFYRRFGGSARTKHIRSPRDGSAGDPQKPIVALPETSGLPKEFVRLCPWEIEFLFTVARRARTGILEIGRYNGGSTFVLSCANPDVPIHSIDIAPQNDELLRQLFREHAVGANVSLIVGNSAERHASVGPLDLLFIDGDHSYDACMADIRTWYDAVAPGGMLAFHDSYDTPEYGVQSAILDLLAEKGNDLTVIVSPLIGPAHWRHPHGSMACLQKKR